MLSGKACRGEENLWTEKENENIIYNAHIYVHSHIWVFLYILPIHIHAYTLYLLYILLIYIN